jgi:translation initiation factor eIF-2B subunit beta
MQVKDSQQQQQQQQQVDNKDHRLTSSDPVVVRQWLERHNRSQQLLALLDKFLMELRQQSGGGGGGEENHDSHNHNNRVLLVFKTVDLLKHLIGPTNWKSAAELLYLIRGIGRELHNAAAAATHREPAIGNVVRRVMAAVREEASSSSTASAAASSAKNQAAADSSFSSTSAAASAAEGNRLTLQSMLWALPQHVRTPSGLGGAAGSGGVGGELNVSISGRPSRNLASSTEKTRRDYPEMYYNTSKTTGRPVTELKQAVMEAIQEIVADLEDSHKNINEQATNHVHAGEVILICGGHSKTLELFLKAAAASAAGGGGGSNKKQANTTASSLSSFQVICCEDAPNGNGGHSMAASLAAAGIVTTVIPDAAVFAIMSRVHKVLIPAHAVLANGGLIACSSGCNMVALAARHNAVPVVCVTGIYKLCPLYPHNGQDTLNDLVSSSCIMDYATCHNQQSLFHNVELVNPIHDYIQPENVNLYVTNAGSFQPSYIYRLLAEYYHHDDWESFD